MKAIVIFSCAWVLSAAALAADGPPPPPPVSSYAPADQLIQLARDYVASAEKSLADETAFDTEKVRLKKDANTLLCIAVALGTHDRENPLQTSAPALFAGAQKLAAATDFAQGQAALAELQAAMKSESTTGPLLKWGKVASMGQIMKQVTFINTRLKRGIRPGPRFAGAADENARYATTLAVIGQAIVGDTHEVKQPEDMPKWYEYSAAMRDSAAELGTALVARDEANAQAAAKKLEQSCSDCHKVFRVVADE